MTWVPSLLLLVLVLPPIYPTGRPTNRFWVWHLRCALTGIGLTMLVMGIADGGVDDTVAGTRLPWETPEWVVWVLGIASVVLLLGTTVTALVGTAVRTVRAGRPERQQLLLLLTVVAVLADQHLRAHEWVLEVAYGLVPITVVVGVLRYRLLGIEVVLRRTLLYVPLTLLVALAVGGLDHRARPGWCRTGRCPWWSPRPWWPSWSSRSRIVCGDSSTGRCWASAPTRWRWWTASAPVCETASDRPVPAMLDAVALATGAAYAAVGTPTDTGSPSTAGTAARPSTSPCGTTVWTSGCSGSVLGRSEPGSPTATVGSWRPWRRTSRGGRRPRLTEDLSRERERVTVATLTERDRLRRDLHDGLGPSLSGIALGLEAADKDAGPEPGGRARALLDRTRQEADSAVREIRRVLDGLRPRALDEHGLDGAVREAAAAMGMNEPGRPRLRIAVDPLPVLSPVVEESAYRILAESLTNVARHSGAGHCAVEIRQVDGTLVLGVEDDGDGCGPGRGGGHGLESMRRRAVDLGGRFMVVEPEPSGTAVTAVLPLEAP